MVNPDNGDFRLASNSSAIDEGAHLTKTTSSGTSTTTVPVDDPLFFSDGKGITTGDSVKIGSNSLVTITTVDNTAKTLTVSAPVTFSTNAYVDLSYSGSGPDIGMVEYDSNSTPMPTIGPYRTPTPTPTPTLIETPTPILPSSAKILTLLLLIKEQDFGSISM